jgi:hypothetical protein
MLGLQVGTTTLSFIKYLGSHRSEPSRLTVPLDMFSGIKKEKRKREEKWPREKTSGEVWRVCAV